MRSSMAKRAIELPDFFGAAPLREYNSSEAGQEDCCFVLQERTEVIFNLKGWPGTA